MSLLGIVASVLSAVLLIGFALIGFHNWAYKAGRREGYRAGVESGRKEESNWWITTEAEVDRTRQKIWREEAQP